MNGPTGTTRVVLACSGLDHAKRGFESFARECFDVLKHNPELDIELVKGSGAPGDRERSVPTLTRESPLAHALGRATRREPFRFEQFEFAFSLLPALLRSKPDVVYFSEWHTGLGLGLLRRLTRARWKLVLCNGTMMLERFGHLDRVQQLTPPALEAALERGANPARQVMLPLGFAIEPELELPSGADRTALRDRLGLPRERRIVLSSAALNRHHKRLHYLIEEVARIPEPERPFLLMAGEPEAETDGIRALARERLGADGHSIRTVPQREVPDLHHASDVFVLASLGEGLPRALIEALANGMPCLTHDYGVTRYALGDHGRYGDFTNPGALAALIQHEPARDPAEERARHRYAYEKFGWDRLVPSYVEMLRGAAK
ncbi:MAG: 1,2-diacylglycerol 3-alpha-glucosyltransferase [Thermoleophilaceae bacterium]|nr:1,2-diacylglycerol 3-alpha-glucosyltransferase [Thermoleophilaceae bacterium]